MGKEWKQKVYMDGMEFRAEVVQIKKNVSGQSEIPYWSTIADGVGDTVNKSQIKHSDLMSTMIMPYLDTPSYNHS